MLRMKEFQFKPQQTVKCTLSTQINILDVQWYYISTYFVARFGVPVYVSFTRKHNITEYSERKGCLIARAISYRQPYT